MNEPPVSDTPPMCGPTVEDPGPQGQDGQDPTYLDLPQGQHVAMEAGSIYALGYNMAGRLKDFDEKVKVISQQLTNNQASEGGVSCEIQPVGRDGRWVHVQNAATYHTKSMQGNETLIQNFRTGMDRVSRITRLIVNEIGGIDAQNNMTLKDLEDTTGLNDKNKTVADYAGSPSDIDDNQQGLPPHMAPR